MKWLKAAGGVLLVGIGIAVLAGWIRFPNTKADVAKGKAERERRIAQLDEDRAEREAAAKSGALVATQDKLRVIGRAYRRHLNDIKTPPSEKDFAELLPAWRSPRDDRPFEIIWGIDLEKVANPSNTLLAWEHSVDENFARCVLMVDGTTLVLKQEEFEKLPRAK